MHTLVQDGITPLTEDQMAAVVRSVDVFLMFGVRGGGYLRFDRLDEVMRAEDDHWSAAVGRQPTQLEIMSACCLLEGQGRLRFDFIAGLMHVATVPCGRGE
jgi:hypothetical protein